MFDIELVQLTILLTSVCPYQKCQELKARKLEGRMKKIDR